MALAANALAARAFRTLTTARMSASSASPRRSAAGGLVAVVYVSEGKSQGVVDALETVARDVCATHGAQVVNVFRDVEYNRTGFTLGARVPPSASIDDAHPTTVEPLRSVAVALAERAMSLVDLRSHAAAHPRCGVVDHISCHAIGGADESLAAALARGIGERVGTLGVPALLYGSASATRVTLADLRRRHGYFRETGGTGAWSGAHVMEGGDVDADYGPRVVPPAAGVVMLGSTPWVCNYNVPVVARGTDGDAVSPAEAVSAARRLGRKVSERGGGLPGVQAMALPHGEDELGPVVEIACNLLNADAAGPEAVQAEVERMCREDAEGVGGVTWDVRKGYVTNLTPEELLERLV